MTEPGAGKGVLAKLGRPLAIAAFVAVFAALWEGYKLFGETTGGTWPGLSAELPVATNDLTMPHLDGLGLCRALRSDPATAGVPVLLVSAKASEEDRVAGLELAQDYLTKPVRTRELVAYRDAPEGTFAVTQNLGMTQALAGTASRRRPSATSDRMAS